MATSTMNAVLEHLRSSLLPTGAGRTDAQLLEREA
jgi:hypothetical protein